MTLLACDMTRICREDPAVTPTQGKVHSDILEHRGWLYFGTHLSDYSAHGRETYTGGHLIGYELATNRFRDFGVIHRNYTNYSAIGLDAARNRIYFYATPFSDGDGPHLHQMDLTTGANHDLGLVAKWRGRDPQGGGTASRANICLSMRAAMSGSRSGMNTPCLSPAARRAGSNATTAALPGNASEWHCLRPLDANRALDLQL